ncbi:MAG TPA: AI-2E family transporter [Steroidobacteraceae bacterium]|nr:AI-2E family transporter [Steroidobacteraceae bacterium]
MSAPHPKRETAHERWMIPAAPRSLTPLVLLGAAAAWALHELQTILLPFVIAGVTAYVCAPLVDSLSMRSRLPRWVAALGVLALLMGAAAALGWLGLPPLIAQLEGVVADLHGAVADFMRALIGTHSVQLLGAHLDAQRTADLVVSALERQMNGTQLLGLLGWGVAAAFGLMLVWVLMGYFLIDAHAIGAGLLWLVPPRGRARAALIWRELDPVLRRYFIGVAVVVTYAAGVAYIGLGLVLGLHHAFVLALLTGVLEIIPMVGPAAAAVIAGLMAVQQAATAWDIWGYVLYATLLRLSIDQLVGPLVLGNAARVHPVVVIFGFLAGGALFGIVGMILAVPAAILIKVSLSVLYREAQ